MTFVRYKNVQDRALAVRAPARLAVFPAMGEFAFLSPPVYTAYMGYLTDKKTHPPRILHVKGYLAHKKPHPPPRTTLGL